MRRELTGVKKGFTLIELSLSLVFIAILSLTVAFIINDTVASYRRGITLKQINTVGMSLVDDIRAAIQGSSTKSIIDDCRVAYSNEKNHLEAMTKCEGDGASKFVFMEQKGNVKLKDKDLLDIQLYGAFCTGTYSYVWNSGYFFNELANGADASKRAVVKLKASKDVKNNEVCTKSGDTMTCEDFRLLKIKDESRAVCMATAGDDYKGTAESGTFDITGTNETVNAAPIDLLATDERNGGLAIYDFNVSGPAESTAKSAMFYAASFVLGTIEGGADITKAGNFCATPDDYEIENFDYCAINKFNFAAQATGGITK